MGKSLDESSWWGERPREPGVAFCLRLAGSLAPPASVFIRVHPWLKNMPAIISASEITVRYGDRAMCKASRAASIRVDAALRSFLKFQASVA